MSKILAKVASYFRSRTRVGVDKAGNQYFVRPEEVDGVSEFIFTWISSSSFFLKSCYHLFI